VTGWNARSRGHVGGRQRKRWAANCLGSSFLSVFAPARAGARRYVETGVGPILNRRLEVTALHRAGHEFPVNWRSLRSGGDQVIFSASSKTSRRQTRAGALRQKPEHLSLVYDHWMTCCSTWGGGRWLPFPVRESAFTAATVAAEQVVGKLVHDVIPEPSLSLVLGKYAEAVRLQRPSGGQETTSYSTGTRYGDVAITARLRCARWPIPLIGSSAT